MPGLVLDEHPGNPTDYLWGRKLLDAAKASPRLAFAGGFSRTPANAAIG